MLRLLLAIALLPLAAGCAGVGMTPSATVTTAVYGWESWLRVDWTAQAEARGSRMIAAHQKLLQDRGHSRGQLDGLAGPGYFRALQADLRMAVVDGEIWNPSATVEVLQRRLNAGRI